MISSSQKPPENLDGIWVPEYDTTVENKIWDIVRSVK